MGDKITLQHDSGQHFTSRTQSADKVGAPDARRALLLFHDAAKHVQHEGVAAQVVEIVVAEGAGQELYPPRAGSAMEGLKRTQEALPLVTRASLLCDCDLFNGCSWLPPFCCSCTGQQVYHMYFF